jgi:hypothetical protein
MTDREFQEVQILELNRLLERAKDDPILAPQLKERIADLKREIEECGEEVGAIADESRTLPRVAIFLRGGGVFGSEGIQPALAGEALIQYEKMFTEQAIHEEREAAKKSGRRRRPRGASTPGLLFTGTPRGSFGLEFVPQSTSDSALLEVHGRALTHVTEALARVISSDIRSLEDIVRIIPSRVLKPLKQFITVLAEYGAEIRLASHDRKSVAFVANQIRTVAERLDKEVIEDTIEVQGIFRGVTLESGNFDFKTNAGELLTGTVSDYLSDDDLERISVLTNKMCVAKVLKTTVQNVAGLPSSTYILIEVNAK